MHLSSCHYSGIIIYFASACHQSNLHGILLVHSQVTSDFYGSPKILTIRLQRFDLFILQNLTSIRCTDFIRKALNLCPIWIYHKSQLLRSIQWCYTVSGKIRLHRLGISIHPVCQRTIQIYHNFRKSSLIKVRTVICSRSIQ